VWPDGVVVVAPLLDQHPGRVQRVEDLSIEQLVPEFSVETLVGRGFIEAALGRGFLAGQLTQVNAGRA
jgi:hypothetical protein